MTYKEKCWLWLHLEGFSSQSVGSVLEACGAHDARDTWRCKAVNLMTGKQKNQREEGPGVYPIILLTSICPSDWAHPMSQTVYTVQPQVLCYSNTKWTKTGPMFLDGIVKMD